jgi:hypothetical protein
MKRVLRFALPVFCAALLLTVFSSPVTAITLTRTVAAGDDDAEERIDASSSEAAGFMDLGSTDLELHSDGPPNDRQWVGIRFTDITIPRGAPISSAFIQFTVDGTDDEVPTNVDILGELVPNSAQFTDTLSNISSRAKTTSVVAWNNIPVWDTIGVAGAGQRTPNLASILQEIVNQPAWTPGNALSLLIRPQSGDTAATLMERTAGAFETDAVGGAPARLLVQFVPEPASCVLAALAAFALAIVRRRCR